MPWKSIEVRDRAINAVRRAAERGILIPWSIGKDDSKMCSMGAINYEFYGDNGYRKLELEPGSMVSGEAYGLRHASSWEDQGEIIKICSANNRVLAENRDAQWETFLAVEKVCLEIPVEERGA